MGLVLRLCKPLSCPKVKTIVSPDVMDCVKLIILYILHLTYAYTTCACPTVAAFFPSFLHPHPFLYFHSAIAIAFHWS